MSKITRSTFLKQSLKTGAIVWLSPSLLTRAASTNYYRPEAELMQRLVAANDGVVEKLLATSFDKRDFNRKIGYDVALLTASYCHQQSRYYHDASLLLPIEKLTQHLLSAQAPDGTVNVGNLESPPDTAFIVEIVTPAAFVLQSENGNAVRLIRDNLKAFLVKTGDALTVGGLHTPNHRWVICAALARINALYPNRRYVARIEEWLAEGVFINADGNYPERSRIYSYVENTAFLSIGRLLNKPHLYAPVRKNLAATWYYMEPNGELVANDSRRQDQYVWKQQDPNSPLTILSYYLLYRYMAINDKSSTFAGIAKTIEQVKGFDERVLNRALIHFMEEPMLQKELPAAAAPETNFEKLFTQSHLLRIRRNDRTTTLFGGTDQPVMIASGRSSSPDFFGFRKGEALLKYMRLSTSFFSTGYFYSDGLKKVGNTWVLQKKLSVPYYQPIPKQLRKVDGDYTLSESIDGRFWNKMDFKNRPVSNVKVLDTTIFLTETNGSNELHFEVKGQAEVRITIELCFKEGGKLTGVAEGENGNNFLEEGMGTYQLGQDAITFGPGANNHKAITNLGGERYSTHFGNLQTEGMRVYITGVTPFKHKLVFS
ncbi:hypothetical protein EXU57_22185 [Segetibacter sp. 3557_3]|uniref:hypothetical protein n=1 Tax=Segetibacter sp. 3557_3 TaxID=2547429 RepID=UPI0010587FA2|nr:hypothetical protein [Segetibacter sp. 3557_3]TDH19988.1 hypothetical protein EXU57_22185 [Segetibacter sp. 3557_3]